jgi:2-C-methyl-D-erythritol 4-phosphate cytidylyltransferase
VKRIVLSASENQIERLKTLAEHYGFNKVSVVEGGSTRHRSICAAVRALLQSKIIKKNKFGDLYSAYPTLLSGSRR